MLVALFLVAGSLASALSASDEQWWQQHFSALGAASDRSGILFNFTLILTGVVLTALADFLTHDLQLWAEHHGEPHWKVTFMRVGLIALGALLGMGLSMGQWLSIPMILAGVILWTWSRTRAISDVEAGVDNPGDNSADDASTADVVPEAEMASHDAAQAEKTADEGAQADQDPADDGPAEK